MVAENEIEELLDEMLEDEEDAGEVGHLYLTLQSSIATDRGNKCYRPLYTVVAATRTHRPVVHIIAINKKNCLA